MEELLDDIGKITLFILLVICFSSRTGGGKAVLARAVVSDVLPEGDRPGVRLGRRHLQERLRHAQEDLQPRCVSLKLTRT